MPFYWGYSQGLKEDLAGGGILRLDVVVQHGENYLEISHIICPAVTHIHGSLWVQLNSTRYQQIFHKVYG